MTLFYPKSPLSSRRLFVSRRNSDQNRALASVSLMDGYTDFLLSRQAMQCTPATLDFYKHMLIPFLTWLVRQEDINFPPDITSMHVRAYLAGLKGADTSKHDRARAIKTLLHFWFEEKYIPAEISFEMPRVARRRLPVLDVDQLRAVVQACANPRDKSIILLMADSGLRRAEVIALNWDDLDFSNGLVRVRRGKGGKARSVVIGAVARRALLAYRRTLADQAGPMFQSRRGTRLTGTGFLLIFRRLSKKSGIHVTPHALRRTFTILSLRAGMDSLHLQALGGWADLTMVAYYAQLEDIDLVEAHSKHSPIDKLGI